MFFRHYWFYVLGLLPARGRFPRYLRAVLGYYDCKDALIAWHRAELGRLDGLFRLQQAGLRLVAAREKARAEGIGPMDPRYPDIFNFSEIDWDEEVRVHHNVLDRFRETGKERMERLDEALREYPQERVDAVTQACVSALKKEDPSGSGTTTP